MRAPSGQSTVEFAAGLSALTLLGLATLSINTWQEAQRRVLASARHSAFERIWMGEVAGAARVSRLYRQHFDDPGLSMPLTGAAVAGEQELEVNPVVQPLEGATGTTERLLLRVLERRTADESGAFDPGGRGWTGSRVDLHPRELPFQPDALRAPGLHFHGTMVLLDDSWSAAGPEQVRQRAGALAPLYALASLQSVVRPLLLPLSLIEPSLSRFCPGLLDPDGVPEDRLSPVAASQPTWNSCR
ncbi:MAG: hypothetical protein RL030_245 [Pseudomonadota bacterium]